MNGINFCKMHGLGNDFVIIDGITQPIEIKNLPIPYLAHRQLGIGFDQLLVILPSDQADFACVIYNSDGSEAEQCGNGMRCIARFVHENQLTEKTFITIATKAGIIEATVEDYKNIRINMGVPCFIPEEIPFKAEAVKETYDITLDEDESEVNLTVLSMGNPHAIMKIDSISDVPVATLGTKIALNKSFPQGANVGFMEIVNRQHILLRTFERGTGETFACGSNACAAVVAGIRGNLLDHLVRVELIFGSLWIQWDGDNKSVMMTGPAEKVFEGTIEL